VNKHQIARWGAIVMILVQCVALSIVGINDVGLSARIDRLRPKADRLDDHCRLMHLVVEDVRRDVDGAEDWKRRAAAYQWINIASFDGRALAPCLHSGVAPILMPCADGDPSCVRLYSAIALASFEPASRGN
jgi:hypothetical protein